MGEKTEYKKSRETVPLSKYGFLICTKKREKTWIFAYILIKILPVASKLCLHFRKSYSLLQTFVGYNPVDLLLGASTPHPLSPDKRRILWCKTACLSVGICVSSIEDGHLHTYKHADFHLNGMFICIKMCIFYRRWPSSYR